VSGPVRVATWNIFGGPASDHLAVEVELDWPPEPGYAWGRSNQVW
jgi:hypothetical protein